MGWQGREANKRGKPNMGKHKVLKQDWCVASEKKKPGGMRATGREPRIRRVLVQRGHLQARAWESRGDWFGPPIWVG